MADCGKCLHAAALPDGQGQEPWAVQHHCVLLPSSLFVRPMLQGIPAVDDTWLASKHDDRQPQGDIPNCAGAPGAERQGKGERFVASPAPACVLLHLVLDELWPHLPTLGHLPQAHLLRKPFQLDCFLRLRSAALEDVVEESKLKGQIRGANQKRL